MWVNKALFLRVLNENADLTAQINQVWNTCHQLQAKHDTALAQKIKDDTTIDWMRHRINALEKERAILLNKVGGVHIPVPEIVPTRPGTISAPLPFEGFDAMPSFEDVGDHEAARLGISHDAEGHLQYKA